MKYLYPVLIFSLTLLQVAKAQQQRSVNPDIGAVTWSVTRQGVHFSLTQLLPDQVRAFYVNRGFALKQIEGYAASCVYMTVLRNDDAPGKIHFISHRWRVVQGGEQHPLRSVDDWIEAYADQGVSKPALIAFRWAQFPPEHEYEPGGDWNQGMLSIGLPAGSRFDITATWNIDGQAYESTLEGVECAK